ncbi:Cation channel sperm-associated protein subunit gamma, partial [Ophiophagus hannah]
MRKKNLSQERKKNNRVGEQEGRGVSLPLAITWEKSQVFTAFLNNSRMEAIQILGETLFQGKVLQQKRCVFGSWEMALLNARFPNFGNFRTHGFNSQNSSASHAVCSEQQPSKKGWSSDKWRGGWGTQNKERKKRWFFFYVSFCSLPATAAENLSFDSSFFFSTASDKGFVMLLGTEAYSNTTLIARGLAYNPFSHSFYIWGNAILLSVQSRGGIQPVLTSSAEPVAEILNSSGNRQIPPLTGPANPIASLPPIESQLIDWVFSGCPAQENGAGKEVNGVGRDNTHQVMPTEPVVKKFESDHWSKGVI